MNLLKYRIKPEYRLTNKLTNAEKKKIVKLRSKGLSYNKIADIMHISRYTAYFYCLSDDAKVEFYKKVEHRPSREVENERQKRFRKRKLKLFKLGGLYKKKEKKVKMIDYLGNQIEVNRCCPFCGEAPSHYVKFVNNLNCITLMIGCDKCNCGKTKVLELDKVGKISLGTVLDAFEKLKEEWNRRVE